MNIYVLFHPLSQFFLLYQMSFLIIHKYSCIIKKYINIYVLLKKTFDKEEKIVIADGQIEDDSAEFIINPYDEYAVEEAIKQRDEHGGEVTVVTIGDEDSEKQLRTA